MENNCKLHNHECPCTKPDCPNHGKCCDCVAFHRELGNVPACLKANVAEMIEKAK